MKKLSLLAFLLMYFVSFSAWAEADNVQIDDDNTNLSYQIEGGETITPAEFKRSLPDCGDGRLLELVRSHVVGYQYRNPPETIIGKRQQMLMLKRISSLYDTSSENVTSKENFKLANELITLKINRSIPAINIKVCKGPKSVENAFLYVVVYNEEDFVKGKIINFADDRAIEQELEFLY